MQPVALAPYSHFTAAVDTASRLLPLARGKQRHPVLDIGSRLLLDQTRGREIPEAQWEAAGRSWKAACAAANVPLHQWYSAMMRTALCAQEYLPPDASPFRSVSIRSSNDRVEVVSYKALQEVLGWDDKRCNDLIETSEIALGRHEIIMPSLPNEEGSLIFDDIMRLVTGEAELTSYPPSLLAVLFVAADQLDALALQTAIVQRCTELLVDPEERERAVKELLKPMLVANAHIVNHVDLSDLLGAYCRGGDADCFIIAIEQAQSPAEWLAIGYEVTQAAETTIRDLAAHFSVEQTLVTITAATSRAALLGSLHAIAIAPDARAAAKEFARANLLTELDEWQQQALTNEEKANRATARGRIVDAFEQNSTKLDISRMWLGSVPKAIGYLTALQELFLSGNQLSSLPAQIGNLTALQQLFLANNQLSSLPVQFGNLTALKKLSLYINRLTSFPKQISYLTALQWLNFANNRFSSLSAKIGNLMALQTLYLNDNQLSALPEQIGNLKVLRSLFLDRNKLSALPAQFGNLTGLQELSLNSNQFSSLPAQCCNLTALQQLFLNGNQLSSLPAQFGNLTELVSLFLDGNRLPSIPAQISNLHGLQYIVLTRNPFLQTPSVRFPSYCTVRM